VTDRVFDGTHLEAVKRRLTDEFCGVFPADEVRREVDNSLAGLADARVQNFLPVLAERGARHRLRARVADIRRR
jgi:hypothetical protein